MGRLYFPVVPRHESRCVCVTKFAENALQGPSVRVVHMVAEGGEGRGHVVGGGLFEFLTRRQGTIVGRLVSPQNGGGSLTACIVYHVPLRQCIMETARRVTIKQC